jgi:hypothetical protein
MIRMQLTTRTASTASLSGRFTDAQTFIEGSGAHRHQTDEELRNLVLALVDFHCLETEMTTAAEILLVPFELVAIGCCATSTVRRPWGGGITR